MKNVTRALQSTKNGTKLAKGGGKGYQQITQNVKKENATHTNEKTTYLCFNLWRFLQKSEGSTARRLQMFYEKK